MKKYTSPRGDSFDFDNEIKESKELSDEVSKEKPPKEKRNIPIILMTAANNKMLELGLNPSPSGLDWNYYAELAETDPNHALAGLRMEIETAVRNLIKGWNIKIKRDRGLKYLLWKLREENAITSSQMSLTAKIITICNTAIHGQRVSKDEAVSVIKSAEALRDQYLSWLSWGFETN